MREAILEVDALGKNFGGLQAIASCTFDVARNSITGVIGPNGAGKTTTLNVVAGEIKPDAGTVRFNGEVVTGARPYRMARLGVARTFQLARELGRLTVIENLCLAPAPQPGESLLRALLRGPQVRQRERQIRERAREVLRTFNLYDKRDELAATLSGGQKKLLEIARAVMAEPQLLLMDEPTAGVNPALRDRILDHIHQLNRDGLTVLIVEHNLSVIDQLCDDVIVMAAGTVLKRGRMATLRQDSDVITAYLGGQQRVSA